MTKRRIRKEQSDENFAPSLLRSDLKHDGSQKPKKRKLKFFHGFTLAALHERDGSKNSKRGRAENFFRCSTLPSCHFYRSHSGSQGFRSLTNAPLSIFIEKVRTFSTLAGIFNIDIFQNAYLASLKENVGFSIKQKSPSHFFIRREDEEAVMMKQRVQRGQSEEVEGEQDKKFFRALFLLSDKKMMKWRNRMIARRKIFTASLLLLNMKMAKQRSEKLGRWQAEKISNTFVPAA